MCATAVQPTCSCILVPCSSLHTSLPALSSSLCCVASPPPPHSAVPPQLPPAAPPPCTERLTGPHWRQNSRQQLPAPLSCPQTCAAIQNCKQNCKQNCNLQTEPRPGETEGRCGSILLVSSHLAECQLTSILLVAQVRDVSSVASSPDCRGRCWCSTAHCGPSVRIS